VVAGVAATIPGMPAPSASPALRLSNYQPMLLKQAKQAFDSDAWTFELKYDGYRLLAQCGGAPTQLASKSGADATKWFPELTAALNTVSGGPHVLDGEVCVLDEFGRTDFNQLHARARQRGLKPGSPLVVYCVFDILVHRGRAVMSAPLEERQQRLAELLAASAAPAHTLLVTGVQGQGKWLYQQAQALRLEGIVAKRLGSPYRPGERSADWLKVKRPGAVVAGSFHRTDV
jgi:bifunctional non-homologous end joining protein LigD